MNKIDNKGFTLIELLAVIIILLGIAGVSVVSITSSLERNDKRECERQKEKIINAAKVYFSLNENDSVTVGKLITNNYLDKDNVSRYDDNSTSVSINNGYIFTGECKEKE